MVATYRLSHIFWGEIIINVLVKCLRTFLLLLQTSFQKTPPKQTIVPYWVLIVQPHCPKASLRSRMVPKRFSTDRRSFGDKVVSHSAIRAISGYIWLYERGGRNVENHNWSVSSVGSQATQCNMEMTREQKYIKQYAPLHTQFLFLHQLSILPLWASHFYDSYFFVCPKRDGYRLRMD